MLFHFCSDCIVGGHPRKSVSLDHFVSVTEHSLLVPLQVMTILGQSWVRLEKNNLKSQKTSTELFLEQNSLCALIFVTFSIS